jgi:CheY-like chemotaxis protein
MNKKDRLVELLRCAGKGREQPLNLLLVDDAEMNYASVIAALKHIDVEPTTTHTALNGYEAIEVIRAEPINLMFLDYHMPRMGGQELLRVLKALKKVDEISIILLTVEDSKSIIQTMVDLGVAAYMRKPIKPDSLKAILS